MSVKIRCIATLLFVLIFCESPVWSQCQVVINEILASPTGSTATNSMYDNYLQATTTGPTQNAEWVELYNPDPCNAVDISCWVLGSDIGLVVINTTTGATMRNRGNFTFPPGTTIPPLGFVSVGGQNSGATFTLNNYWGTSNLCMADNRWFLRDTYGYLLLANAAGAIVDAVYWAPTAADLNVATTQFGNRDTTTCACNVPQGPGTQTYYFAAAMNIPGIEYAGDNYTANGSPNPGLVPPTDSYGFSMKRQQDGSSTWVINGTKTINGCNGACYSLTANNFSATIPCTQTTGTATGSHTVTGFSHAPYTYSWSNGATGASVSGLAAGAYSYTVTDVCGCTKTANANLTQAPGFTTAANGTNPTCAVPGSVSATNTGGTSTFTYSWSTNPVQTTQTATGLQAGTYSVLVTDAGGCTATSSTTITQPNAVGVTTTVTPASCNPDGSALASASGGNSVYTYSWNNGQTNAQATGLNAGTYSITVTDGNGCTATSTAVITQPGGITLTPASTPQTCAPIGTASVSATGPGTTYTYSWSNGQTNAQATGLTQGDYTVIVTDNNNCSNSSVITVTQVGGLTFGVSSTPATCAQGGSATASVSTGNPAYTYSWSNGGNSQTISNLAQGVYTVTITDADACSQTQTVTVTQIGGVDITLSLPATICPGASTILTATSSTGTSPYTYSWSTGTAGTSTSVSPAATTTYTCTVTDGNGCTSTQTVLISVLDNPLSLSTNVPAEICEGGQTSITVTPTGGNLPLTYSWSDAGQTTTTITVNPVATITYTVVATDACNISSSTTVDVVVNPNPISDFTMIIPTDCYLVCVDFTDASSVSSGTIQSWQWDFGDKGTSDQQDPQHCYTTSGNYNISLTVTSDKNCKKTFSQTANVVVDPPPVANFMVTPTTAVLVDNVTATFFNQTVGGITYFWNFGDSLNETAVDTSVEFNPSHTYADTGNYCISLIATNTLGCSDTSIQCIEIKPDWTFYAPNSFTPNGSGDNDVFAPEYTNITDVQLWIYDRWGNLIYNGKGQNAFWDGKVQGGASNKLAQIDTYVWVISFVDNTQASHRKVGHVNLLR